MSFPKGSRAFDADEAERLYRAGMSARAVAVAVNSNRESVRRVMSERGVVRGRLERRQDRPSRIMDLVDKNGANGCWLWAGAKNNKGYGMTVLNGRRTLAHRAVYELHCGAPPRALHGCHRCDNPICVNPAHIFFGTRADNMQDALKKGRFAVGERSPSARYTERQIREAHSLWRAGATIAKSAKATGMRRGDLWAILRGKSWRHLDLEGVQ